MSPSVDYSHSSPDQDIAESPEPLKPELKNGVSVTDAEATHKESVSIVDTDDQLQQPNDITLELGKEPAFREETSEIGDIINPIEVVKIVAVEHESSIDIKTGFDDSAKVAKRNSYFSAARLDDQFQQPNGIPIEFDKEPAIIEETSEIGGGSNPIEVVTTVAVEHDSAVNIKPGFDETQKENGVSDIEAEAMHKK